MCATLRLTPNIADKVEHTSMFHYCGAVAGLHSKRRSGSGNSMTKYADCGAGLEFDFGEKCGTRSWDLTRAGLWCVCVRVSVRHLLLSGK